MRLGRGPFYFLGDDFFLALIGVLNSIYNMLVFLPSSDGQSWKWSRLHLSTWQTETHLGWYCIFGMLDVLILVTAVIAHERRHIVICSISTAEIWDFNVVGGIGGGLSAVQCRR